MKTIAILMLAAASQQDRMTEFRVNQMRDRLGLNEEQVAKVREILAKEEEERAAKIAGVLDEEQKKQYEELRRNPFGGSSRGGTQNLQMRGGMGAVRIEQLKSELSLTDEQVGKIQPLVDEYNAAIQKRAEELRQGGLAGLDWQSELAKFGESLKAFNEKVKAHLTDEQKPKADALAERATAWTRMIPGMAQRFQGGGGTATRTSAEDRVRRAVEALGFEKEEEREAVRALIGKVVRAQDAVEDYAKSTRDRMAEAARNAELSEEALDDRIGEARKERRRLEKELSDLQAQLSDVLTRRQEAALIQQGLLR